MTEDLLCFIDDDETLGLYYPKAVFPKRDVWMIHLGRPSDMNQDIFRRAYAAAEKRLIVEFSCNTVNYAHWNDIINELDVAVIEDELLKTCILDKTIRDI